MPRPISIPHTRREHASVRNASAAMVSTILQVSHIIVSQVDSTIPLARRSSSRKRIHLQRNHIPMEESPTGLKPKSIGTSAGRTSFSILCISVLHTYLALYTAASISWDCLYVELIWWSFFILLGLLPRQSPPPTAVKNHDALMPLHASSPSRFVQQ
jgi:hypothetical protein